MTDTCTLEAAQPSAAPERDVRVLVAIASYGEKNLCFLNAVVECYRSMPMRVDVVVLSEKSKPLPPGVKVVVGLPSKNPWSLPFGHKAIFAENVDRYDIFIYSEDDMAVTEENIRAFLRAGRVLRPNEIAGFMRYERDGDGRRWMPDVHAAFCWKPESVVARGEYLFAEHTNHHSACYAMTRAQLRAAIASGGYLRAPHNGKYDMLVSAATDPYTSCGLRKMICVSQLDDFLVHHMSNRYVGQMGLSWSAFAAQVDTLRTIARGAHPATTLCPVETNLPGMEWSKDVDDRCDETVLSMVPTDARTVLSVGCGSGATEAALVRRGAEVTALPVNSVLGAAVAGLGVRPVYGPLDECLRRLRGRQFDCVLITDLLHLQGDPETLFRRALLLVRDGGTILASSPNFDRFSLWARRLAHPGEHRKLRTFRTSGVTVLRPGSLGRWAARAGCSAFVVRWNGHALPATFGLRRLPLRLGRFSARRWALRATRGRSR